MGRRGGAARFAVPANLDIRPLQVLSGSRFPAAARTCACHRSPSAPPPPSAPTVESVLQVPPQNDVIDQRPIQGPAPAITSQRRRLHRLSSGADRGSSRFRLARRRLSAVSCHLSDRPVGHGRLVSANGVPFNRVIIGPRKHAPDGSPLSASCQQITLASPSDLREHHPDRRGRPALHGAVRHRPWHATAHWIRGRHDSGHAPRLRRTAGDDVEYNRGYGIHVIDQTERTCSMAIRRRPAAPRGWTWTTPTAGPENIFVATGAAVAGTYRVFLVHYSGPAPAVATIRRTGHRSECLVRTFHANDHRGVDHDRRERGQCQCAHDPGHGGDWDACHSRRQWDFGLSVGKR